MPPDPRPASASRSSDAWPGAVVNVAKSKPAKKILRRMMRAVETWSLVEPGDRIMVALSGGKDSYGLFDLLWHTKRRAPFSFDIIGVHLDQAQPGYDNTEFVAWLDNFGAPYQILREDTYSVVQQKTRPGQAYCFVCSRLRRGILYTAAEKLGCNKIALGHHRDDAIETLLLNLFFAGKLQAMPARYTTDDGRFTVIRPLIEVAEEDLATLAETRGYPILPCNLCGSQDGLKRQEIKTMLAELTARYPDIKQVMLHALQNVRPSHLLDVDVERVWMGREPRVRPVAEVKSAPTRHAAKAVRTSGLLPVIHQL